MLRIWRLLRLALLIVIHVPYASLAVRLRPAAERSVFRAARQQDGSRRICRVLRVRVAMHGTVPARPPMLLVCNHLGMLDPFVLASQMRVSFVGMVEISRWPVLGWICRTMGLLFVERGRPTRKTVSFVEQVQQKLGEGVSVLAFPEGTTSGGDTVQPFKTGAFEAVARLDGGAVLPLYLRVRAIAGKPAPNHDVAFTDDSLAVHFWHLVGLESVDVDVAVGEPIATAERDRKELARRAHQAVCALAAAPR